MKRKIIVACGGAVATSTMAAEEIKELCQNHNIPVELIQCRVNEIETYMDGVHLTAFIVVWKGNTHLTTTRTNFYKEEMSRE